MPTKVPDSSRNVDYVAHYVHASCLLVCNYFFGVSLANVTTSLTAAHQYDALARPVLRFSICRGLERGSVVLYGARLDEVSVRI